MPTVCSVYPLSISGPSYGYLKLHKATWKGKKLKKDLRSRMGIELKTSRTKGRVLTDCGNNCFLSHD